VKTWAPGAAPGNRIMWRSRQHN